MDSKRNRNTAPAGTCACAFVLGLATTMLLPTVAFAEPTVQLKARDVEETPPLGWSPQVEAELSWSRLVLQDEVPMLRFNQSTKLSFSELLDVEQDVFALRARALMSLVSAVGPLVSKGTPMLEVVRNGKVRQRHRLRAFWRSRGAMLVWRIDF